MCDYTAICIDPAHDGPEFTPKSECVKCLQQQVQALEDDNKQAYTECVTVAEAMCRDLFPENTAFEVLPDLRGVISQIDNMSTAIPDLKQQVQAAKDLIGERVMSHCPDDNESQCAWCGHARKHDLVGEGWAPPADQQGGQGRRVSECIHGSTSPRFGEDGTKSLVCDACGCWVSISEAPLRTRLAEQEQELAKLREQVQALEEDKDELQSCVAAVMAHFTDHRMSACQIEIWYDKAESLMPQTEQQVGQGDG